MTGDCNALHPSVCTLSFGLHAQDACNFVDVGGQQITEAERLSEALRSLEREGSQFVQLFETDHVVAPKGITSVALQAQQKANRTAVAVLYGAVGTPGFKGLHETLMQSALTGDWPTILSAPSSA